MQSTKVDTLIRNIETGRAETLTQTITLTEDGELIYTVEGGEHEVIVNAAQYVSKLRELTGL